MKTFYIPSIKKKKKERTENSSHKKGEINHTCWENSEDALNVHLRKPSEEHSQKQTDQN